MTSHHIPAKLLGMARGRPAMTLLPVHCRHEYKLKVFCRAARLGTIPGAKTTITVAANEAILGGPLPSSRTRRRIYTPVILGPAETQPSRRARQWGVEKIKKILRHYIGRKVAHHKQQKTPTVLPKLAPCRATTFYNR
jgi:hypothetical protein